jgi:hypothetical protein
MGNGYPLAVTAVAGGAGACFPHSARRIQQVTFSAGIMHSQTYVAGRAALAGVG